MGQTLSEPLTEKTSEEGQDVRVAYGVSAMQGWRISMEDAHAAILNLTADDSETDKTADDNNVISFFGVYDGHGGDKVAIYTGENLHKIVARQEAFLKKNYEQALKDGFLATDRAILSDPKYEEEVSGCTASVGLITHDKIYVANAGDSRSVLGIKGRAKPLSQDHKPTNEPEKQRIQAAGGFVDFGRVNGNLALSRAIGDFEFKKTADLPPEQQIVTAYPDVSIHDIGPDDEFLVIACDGIWDCQSSQSVVEFVRRGVVAKQELHKIAENLMDNCLASNSDTGGVGCDNMTVIIVALLRGKTKEEWYDTIAKRVADGDGPCAPPEYAEQRGPGNRRYEDSGDELDLEQRTSPFGRPGRIILLGDGTEIFTDSDDPEMFGHGNERVTELADDVDPSADTDSSGEAKGDNLKGDLSSSARTGAGAEASTARTDREGTPAPEESSNKGSTAAAIAAAKEKSVASGEHVTTVAPETAPSSGGS